MQNRFCIGIPTLNRADLLIPTVLKYKEDFPKTRIYIVDNGRQNLDKIKGGNVRILYPPKNIGVAASWNKLCYEIFNHTPYALILNDDIYLGYGEKTVLAAIKKSNSGLVQSDKNWSCFILERSVYNKIGVFDELFYPAYFEDSDYIYRAKLLGYYREVDYTLSPKVFRENMTREKDSEVVDKYFAKNRQRYINKWGNIPMLETYATPFNVQTGKFKIQSKIKDTVEYPVCSFFGCGKMLTIQEQLYSDYCFLHN